MMTHMVKNTAKKLSVATAFAALTCSALGTGAAGAQEMSSLGGLDKLDAGQIEKLSSMVLGKDNKDNAVMEKYEDIKGLQEALPADQAQQALDGTFTAKNNDSVFVTFEKNGTLTYSDGCNNGNGTYQVDQNGAVEVDNMVETKMACEPSVMQDAQQVKQILAGKPAVFSVDDSTFALGSQGQAIQFVKGAATAEK